MIVQAKNTFERPCEDCGRPFVASKYAKFCPVCRPLHRRHKTVKYKLDGHAIEVLREQYNSRVRGRLAAIARKLGCPKFAVQRAAHRLGLVHPAPAHRRAWTAEENAFVRQWAGKRSPEWMAQRLKRRASSVVLRMKRMDLTRAVREGYNVRELTKCFGVDHHIVERWIERGWLRKWTELSHSTNGKTFLRISEKEVLRFIRQHPLEFPLRNVDQLWFIGLLLGAPLPGEDEQ